MYEGKILVRKDYDIEPESVAGEQEFYAEKGFTNEPQHCKAYRPDRKSSRGDSSSERTPREMCTAIYASCGATCRVPFQPRNEHPVYCNDYFANRG